MLRRNKYCASYTIVSPFFSTYRDGDLRFFFFSLDLKSY